MQITKELGDLKVNYQMKCKENESLYKEIAELKDTMNKKTAYGSMDSVESKKMMEEV